MYPVRPTQRLGSPNLKSVPPRSYCRCAHFPGAAEAMRQVEHWLLYEVIRKYSELMMRDPLAGLSPPVGGLCQSLQ